MRVITYIYHDRASSVNIVSSSITKKQVGALHRTHEKRRSLRFPNTYAGIIAARLRCASCISA